jgi:hypothetical protein
MHIVPRHILQGEASIQTSAFNSNPIGTGPLSPTAALVQIDSTIRPPPLAVSPAP